MAANIYILKKKKTLKILDEFLNRFSQKYFEKRLSFQKRNKFQTIKYKSKKPSKIRENKITKLKIQQSIELYMVKLEFNLHYFLKASEKTKYAKGHQSDELTIVRSNKLV